MAVLHKTNTGRLGCADPGCKVEEAIGEVQFKELEMAATINAVGGSYPEAPSEAQY